MFPPTCRNPPWRNIDVKMVAQPGIPEGMCAADGPKKFFGTKPSEKISACESRSSKVNSQKKATIQTTISAQVTKGVSRVGFSSEIGIMKFARAESATDQNGWKSVPLVVRNGARRKKTSRTSRSIDAMPRAVAGGLIAPGIAHLAVVDLRDLFATPFQPRRFVVQPRPLCGLDRPIEMVTRFLEPASRMLRTRFPHRFICSFGKCFQPQQIHPRGDPGLVERP